MSPVEIGTYDTAYYPALLDRIDAVEPHSGDIHPSEALSDDLLYIHDMQRKLGFLATNNWLDHMSFQLCADLPALKHIDTKTENPLFPYHAKIRTKWPLKAAEQAFINMCLLAVPEYDVPRQELAIFSRPMEVMPFVAGIRNYTQSRSNDHDIANLLVSRSIMHQFMDGHLRRGLVGIKQKRIINKILQTPTGPRVLSSAKEL